MARTGKQKRRPSGSDTSGGDLFSDQSEGEKKASGGDDDNDDSSVPEDQVPQDGDSSDDEVTEPNFEEQMAREIEEAKKAAAAKQAEVDAEEAAARQSMIDILVKVTKMHRAAAEAIYDDQQICTFADMVVHHKDEDIKRLFDTLRKPGGGKGGVNVSVNAEKSFSMLAYQSWICHAASVVPTSKVVFRVDKNDAEAYREYVRHYTAPTAPPKVDHKDWTMTLERVRSWIGQHIGTTGLPLAYVIRDKVAVPLVPIGGPDAYGGIEAFLTARAAIVDVTPGRPAKMWSDDKKQEKFLEAATPTFRQDNKLVFQRIDDLLKEVPAAGPYIRDHKKKENGCQLYFDLMERFQGRNHTLIVTGEQLAILQNTR